MKREKIKEFIDKYYQITNKNFFDFIEEYGANLFFLDLWKYFDGENDKFYVNINHRYYTIKNYFETH